MSESQVETTALSLVKNRKKFMICKISLWKLFAYFVLYSIVGYILETIYAIITTGILESRQSFLYGPFCAIYGLGAVVMIIFLQFFKKNNYTLFLGGILVGSSTEYLVSLIGEWLFNTKWWDYSKLPLNINGRICLLYSIFWGLLAIYLMTYLNPKMDKLFNFIKEKINVKVIKTFLLITLIFISLDYIISCFATTAFLSRTIVNNNLDVSNKTKVENEYKIIYSTKVVSDFVYKYFGDEKMLKTFPNLKIETNDKKIILVRELYPEINPYYFKITYLSINIKGKEEL